MAGGYCRSLVPLCPQQLNPPSHNNKENQRSRVVFPVRLLITISLLTFLVSIPVGIVAQTREGSGSGGKSTLSAVGTSVPNESASPVSVARLGVPAKAAKHLEWAQKRFTNSDLPGAITEIDQALEIYPRCAQAFSMRAFVKLALKDFSGAIEDAHRSVALDPYDPASNLALATAYNDEQNFSQAAGEAQQALRLNPNGWQGRLELAKSLYGEGRLEAALVELNTIKKDFPDIHLVRGNVLMRLGRTREGAAEFAHFLDEAPQDVRAGVIQQIIARTDVFP